MILAAITTHKRKPEMVERAVRSVIAQTYTDWNLVVVDDSPADWEFRGEVRKMVEGYAQLDGRIRYVAHDRNYGAQRARNTALGIAANTHGGGGYEFIAYLDDDDEWLPEKLEKQLARLEECGEDTGLVYCNSRVLNDNTGLMRDINNPGYEGNIHDRLMLENMVGSASFTMLRTKAFADVGDWDEEFESCQDWDMWIRITKQYNVAFVNEQLVNYHIHNSGNIGDSVDRYIQGLERILSKNWTYYVDHKYAHWKSLQYISRIYCGGGYYKKSFRAFFKAVVLQPLRLWENFRAICYIVKRIIKDLMKRYSPKMFYALKGLKQKLKGEDKSWYPQENRH